MSSSNPISASSSSSSSGNVSMPSPFAQSLLSLEEEQAFSQEQQDVSMLSSPTSTPSASSSSSSSSSNLPKEESTDEEFDYIAGSLGKTDTPVELAGDVLRSRENQKALDKHYKEATKVREDTSNAVKSLEESRSKNPSPSASAALIESRTTFLNSIKASKKTYVEGSKIENKQGLKITDTDSSASQRRSNSPPEIEPSGEPCQQSKQQAAKSGIKEFTYVAGDLYHSEYNYHQSEIVESLPSNVKQNVACFVPRQEITDKLKKTFSEHPEGSTIVLTGQRGAGKTQIARYVCYEYEKSEAARLILELDAINSSILLDEYKRLGALLGLQLTDNEKPQDVQLRVKNALLKLKHPSIMLFFDNAYDYATIAPYLCPSSNDKMLYALVTSYNTAIWHGVPNVIPIRPPLQPKFTLNEAIIYIKNERNLPAVSNEDANQLAELLHCHPLALTQAVSYILQDSTIGEFCQKYKGFKPKPLDEKLEGDYPESVVNVIDFALEKLSDSAKEILYACSLLHSKNIPKRLIEEALHPLLYQDNIKELQSFSLLTRSDDASGNTPVYYELHELTQEIVRYRLSPDKKAIQMQLLDFFVNSELKNYSEILSSEKEELREKEYSKQLLRHAESFLKYFDISNLSAEQDKKYACFLSHMGRYFHWQADHEKARNMHEQALKIRIAVHGDNHPEVAICLDNLGAVLYALGQYAAAKKKQEQVLKIYRALYGDHHPNTATCLNNLGEVLDTLGQYEAAQEKHEQALKINRAFYGDHHPNVATSLNHLGGVLDALGQYEAAKEKFEQALKIYRAIYKDNHHPAVTTSLNNLGAALAALGQYEAAQEKHEQALKIHRAIHGENHPDVALSLNNLGGVLRALKQYEAAQEKHEQALKISRAIYGDNHPAVATCLNTLGAVLYALRQYKAAQEKHEQALKIRIAIYGDNHPAVATCLDNLGVALYALEQYGVAKEKLEQALKIYRTIYKDNHPEVATCLNNLGAVLRALRQYEAVKEKYEEKKCKTITKYKEDRDGWSMPTLETALRRATLKGEKNDVKLLLEYGAKIDAPDPKFKRSALHIAYKRQLIEIVALLISKGANTQLKDHYGKIPSDYGASADDSLLPGEKALNAQTRRNSPVAK